MNQRDDSILLGLSKMDKISFDDFKKIELKVGKILQAERVEETDKLYKLQVDVGEESPRQIVSGIVPYYSVEELTGKLIIVCTNLKPARFKGEESNGMLLAASNEDESICVLLSPEKEIAPGSRIT